LKNKAGKTALQLAINAGFPETAQVLRGGPTILTLALDEMRLISTCGWLVSVLRSPYGNRIYPSKSNEVYSLATSCTSLSENGLDATLGDLMTIIAESDLEQVLDHMGLPNFAARTRARGQLRSIFLKYQQVEAKAVDSNATTVQCQQ